MKKYRLRPTWMSVVFLTVAGLWLLLIAFQPENIIGCALCAIVSILFGLIAMSVVVEGNEPFYVTVDEGVGQIRCWMTACKFNEKGKCLSPEPVSVKECSSREDMELQHHIKRIMHSYVHDSETSDESEISSEQVTWSCRIGESKFLTQLWFSDRPGSYGWKIFPFPFPVGSVFESLERKEFETLDEAITAIKKCLMAQIQ